MFNEFNAEELVDAAMEEMEEMDEEFEEADMITLNMEDGSEVPCIVLGIVEVEGQDYIALLPADEEMLAKGESEGFIFRYSEDEEGMPVLEGIEDEEFRRVAKNVAHYHHERWDGSGYPEKLSGENIPLEARIMAIADVYDALVSKRCYKERMSFEEAHNIIKEGMGKHFDASLYKYFLGCREELEKYYMQCTED